MTIVFYDTETTGVDAPFDQILQFAAIRTDAELNEIERFEVRSRLQPHIIPDLDALKVNRASVAQLTDPHLPSHYEMVRAIRNKLQSWSPALFVGYNSLRFDEQFLRQALYQTLHAPYLTNTNGNSRSDVMRMLQAASVFTTNALALPVGDDGRPIFRLDRVAPANGFNHSNAHEAVADVEATIHMCRLLSERAPDIWSAFMRFSQKAAVTDYITSEPIYCLSDFYGGRCYSWLVTTLGRNPDNGSEYYVFDLGTDPADLASLTLEELVERLQLQPRPVRRLRSNAAPILMPLDLAPEFASGRTLAPAELDRRTAMLRADPDLGGRLMAAFEVGREKPSSVHVELQIYDGFFSNDDQLLLDQFHEVPWEQRPPIVEGLSDIRLKRLGQRLMYLERPGLFAANICRSRDRAYARRVLGNGDEPPPWRTLAQALLEIEEALSAAEADDVAFLMDHRGYLRSCLERATKLLA